MKKPIKNSKRVVPEDEKRVIHEFLLKLLHPNKPVDVNFLQQLNEIQQKYLLQICKQKRIYPIVYNKLKEFKGIPEEILNRLGKLTKNNAVHNLELFSSLLSLLDALSKSGIHPILLKGSYLAPVIYGNLANRILRDIDILVKMEDVEKTQDVLTLLGYKQAEDKKNIFATEKEKIDYFSRNKDLFAYIKNGLHIEVHQKITYDKYPHINIDELWGRSIPIKILESDARIFHPEDFLLHLCLHLAYQDDFTNGLQALHDIYLFCEYHRHEINLEETMAKAEKYKMLKGFLLTMYLCKEFTGLDIGRIEHNGPYFESNDEIVIAAIDQMFSPRVTIVHREFVNENTFSKPKMLAKKIFIPKSVINTRYGTQKNIIGYTLAYLKFISYSLKTHASPILVHWIKSMRADKRVVQQNKLVAWLKEK